MRKAFRLSPSLGLVSFLFIVCCQTSCLFNPDSTKIVLVNTDTIGVSKGQIGYISNGEIYLLNPADGAARQVTFNGKIKVRLSLRADRQQVVYTTLGAPGFPTVENLQPPYGSTPNLFAIATLAVMCGSDDIRSIVEYAKDEHEWLKTFLPLPHGIPSISTFRRVLAALKPRALEDLIKRWSGELAGSLAGKQIAIDGKALRHSFDKASEQSHVHLVTAWSVEDKLVLAQQAVDQKGNEITALPEVLKMLDLKDATVTVDAMGTQTDIAEQIVKGGGNYVMAVKDNHPTLSDTITRNLDEMVLEKFKDVKHVYYESTDAGHGRIDQRKVWATSDIQWLARRGEWKNLKSVIVVESTRQEVLKNDLSKTKSSTMRRYYISSLPSESGEKLASLIPRYRRKTLEKLLQGVVVLQILKE